jgi:hypothetical protein
MIRRGLVRIIMGGNVLDDDAVSVRYSSPVRNIDRKVASID